MRLQRYGFFFVTRYLSVEKMLFLTIFYHFSRFLLCFFLFFYKERKVRFFVCLRFFKAILQTVNNFFCNFAMSAQVFSEACVSAQVFNFEISNLKYNLIKK